MSGKLGIFSKHGVRCVLKKTEETGEVEDKINCGLKKLQQMNLVNLVSKSKVLQK